MESINVIPAVECLELTGSRLCLKTPLLITVMEDEFTSVATLLAEYLDPLTLRPRIELGSTSHVGDVIFLQQDDLAAEAYGLEINEEYIQITASDSRGAFYAVQTLRQLLFQNHSETGDFKLPTLLINDCARLRYRGMHLDVSRHFFDVSFIKKYIDLLALHKMNVFHWHLTDDAGWRIEIERYPQLVDVGSVRSGTVVGFTLDVEAKSDEAVYQGYYSQQDVQEIVAYAAQRHITVVPEIDIPGHASAMLAAYPELGCTGAPSEVKVYFGNFDDVLCPSQASFEFLTNVLTEVATLFPGPYIHIGGDEVKTTRWQHCHSCLGLMKEHDFSEFSQLQSYFMRQVGSIVTSLGKTAIAWDDVIDEQIDPNMTIMSWLCKDQAIGAVQAGHDVIMTPMEHAYFDFYQSHCLDEPPAIHGLTRLQDVYQFDPLESFPDPDHQSRILGGQGNLWTEYVKDPDTAERMVLPRMSALAEVLWTSKLNQSWSDFCRRLPGFEGLLHRLDYVTANSHYKPHLVAEQTSPGRFIVAIESLANTLVYTLDGSTPTVDSNHYEQPLLIDTTTTVRATSVLNDQKLLGDARLTLVNHLALGQSVQFAHLNDAEATLAEQTLLNGQISHDRIFYHPEWIAFVGIDMDAIISFDRPTLISSITLGFDAGAHRNLHRPSGITIMIPDTNNGWLQVASMDQQTIDRCNSAITLSLAPQRLSTLRVVAHNKKSAWSVELEAIGPVTLYIDEIIVH